jgi:rare lipoprotein A
VPPPTPAKPTVARKTPAREPAASAAPPKRAAHYIQVGAFSRRENAVAARERAAAALGVPPEALQLQEATLYRVVAGPFAQPTESAAAAEKIRAATGLQAVPIQLR